MIAIIVIILINNIKKIDRNFNKSNNKHINVTWGVSEREVFKGGGKATG